MYFAQIRDGGIFRELPLELGDDVDRVAGEAKVINVGGHGREGCAIQSDKGAGVGRTRFET